MALEGCIGVGAVEGCDGERWQEGHAPGRVRQWGGPAPGVVGRAGLEAERM